MQSDITRQVSANVYSNSSLRNKIYEFAKDPYHAVVNSYGMDTSELLKHTFNARKKRRNYYQFLFLPAIILWGFIILIFVSEGEILEGGAFLIGFISFVISYIIVLIYDVNQRNFLKNNLYKDSYNPDFEYTSSNSHLIEKFNKKTSGNLVIYSGYSPFVGSGIDIGGWSFVVDIDKGKKELNRRLSPKDFDISEIYARVDDEIESLNIPNSSVTDKVFINGKKIRNNPEILPNKLGHPSNNVSQEYLEKVMKETNTDARFYRVIQVNDWEGDLILTAFLRFQKSEKSLFVENNYYLLPPVSEDLKTIDKIKEESGIRHFLGWIFSLFFITLGHTFMSIFRVLGYINEVISSIFGGKESVMRKLVKSSPDFDYGAETSIREAVSQLLYSQHFQKLDKERYFKIIEKRIFNMLEDFLDSKNIDSSEFKERETSILNNGVLVTGGNLKADNIAVGKKSKINNFFKGQTQES